MLTSSTGENAAQSRGTISATLLGLIGVFVAWQIFSFYMQRPKASMLDLQTSEE